ncbi:MAG: hypothetical protein M1816_006822 [Peltula sp. TS41687]|nr:MAG: hypothetical protein M1816_006822 [Peltula sp. TS41687]
MCLKLIRIVCPGRARARDPEATVSAATAVVAGVDDHDEGKMNGGSGAQPEWILMTKLPGRPLADEPLTFS